MKLRFLGQNCFLITTGTTNILTDPFYSYQKDKSGFLLESTKVDYILLTHVHQDHMADVKQVLEHYPQATLIAQPEICGYFSHSSMVDLNFGGTLEIGKVSIDMVPALHTSSFPDGSYGGLSCGYLLQSEGGNLYLAGDTGLTMEMKLLKEFYGPISISILPVGGHYTMDYKKAAYAAKNLLDCAHVVGCHFDTFPPISIDHQKAKAYFEAMDIELKLPELGEEWEV